MPANIEFSDDEVKLVVGGTRELTGWSESSVTSSIEDLAQQFTVTLTDETEDFTERLPDKRSSVVPNGSKVEVFLGNNEKGWEPVLVGHVDTINTGFDKSGLKISISGRSITGDLVDCEAEAQNLRWTNEKPEIIAADLLSPYGITVKCDLDTLPLKSFAFSPGDKVADVLRKLTEQSRMMLTSDLTGALLMFFPGDLNNGATDFSEPLIEFKNMISISEKSDFTKRFSVYRFFGQGRKASSVRSGSNVQNEVRDSMIERYRPNNTVAKTSLTPAQAQKLASFQRTIRAAQSWSVTGDMSSWRFGNGQMVRPNGLTHLKAPRTIGFDDPVLITAVSYKKGKDGGTSAGLTLKLPGVYSPGLDPQNLRSLDIEEEIGV